MALASFSGLAQYDVVGVREDLSDVVSQILLADTNLLSRIGIAGEATNAKHEWLESSLNATTVTDNETGGLDAAGTNVDLVVTTGQGARVRIGTLLKNTTRGKTEVLQVTTISTDTLTVTRGYGSTSPEAAAQGTVWRIIGRPKQSGEDASSDRSTVRTRVANYCQIFEDALVIAGDAEAVLKAGIPSEVGFQGSQRLMELMRELDISFINGISSASIGSDSVYRSMGGLIEFLTSGSTPNSNSTGEELSPDVINTSFQQAYSDGGNPTLLAVNQTQMKKISRFDADKVRVVPGAGSRGSFVTHFMTELGTELEIVVDRWIPDDVMMILDPTRIKVVSMPGRAFGITPLARTGDAEKRQILGDYTCEVRNAGEAHAIHTNLSTT